jgi:hypothetical protein
MTLHDHASEPDAAAPALNTALRRYRNWRALITRNGS